MTKYITLPPLMPQDMQAVLLEIHAAADAVVHAGHVLSQSLDRRWATRAAIMHGKVMAFYSLAERDYKLSRMPRDSRVVTPSMRIKFNALDVARGAGKARRGRRVAS